MVVAEQFARASKTGDDLVEDQQHAVLVADLPHARQVFVRRNQYAAAGDDRLHQQRGDCLRPFINDRFLKRLRAGDTVFGRAEFGMPTVGIGGRNVNEPGRHRPIADLALGLAGGAHRAQSIAVISAVAGDDLVAGRAACFAGLLVILAGDFEGDLIRFGAAGGEVDPAAPAQQLQYPVRQLRAGRVGHGGREIGQFHHLRGRRLRQLAAPIPNVHTPQARHRIQIATALVVFQVAAFPRTISGGGLSASGLCWVRGCHRARRSNSEMEGATVIFLSLLLWSQYRLRCDHTSISRSGLQSAGGCCSGNACAVAEAGEDAKLQFRRRSRCRVSSQ